MGAQWRWEEAGKEAEIAQAAACPSESASAQSKGEEVNLRPSIAGAWFPADPAELRGLIEQLLELVPVESSKISAAPRGLLVPHAGLAYSGSVAALAYASLEPEPTRTVVILAPFHAYHESPFLVCEWDGYQTPLGAVTIDRELIDRIDESLSLGSGLHLTPTGEATEHSIEIQLPFLQTVLGTIRLVPIMLAHQTPTTVAALVGALTSALGREDPLLIASSDLSHFNPQHLAVLMDREMLSRITSYQAEAVLHAEHEGAGSACGAGAIATMLLVGRAFGAIHSKVLGYRTSGEATGDFHSVIGYAAAAFW